MKKLGTWKTLLLILAFVAIVVLFIFFLGRVNPTNIVRKAEFREDPDEALKNNRRYKVVVKPKQELQIQLQRTFKRIYFGVRIGLVSLWGVFLYLLYKNDLIHTPEDLLIYSQFAMILFGVASFISFGNLSNLKNFINILEAKVENVVYGKFINLKDEIITEEISLIQSVNKSTNV